MRFGAFPLAESEGLILAHSVRANGVSFKKGRILTLDDIRKLDAAGATEVTGAILDPDDVPEDDAALQVAEAVRGDGLSLGKPFTGRCNLFAETAGLVVVDSERLDSLNLVDESMTVGTLAPFSAVEPGQMVGTVKVIPFAAPRDIVAKCASLAGNPGPLVRIAAWRKLKISLIQTRLASTKESVLDSTTAVVRARLAALDNDIDSELRCAHDQKEVAEAIAARVAAGSDLVLVAGASAIVDRRDVIPAAIVDAGGEVDHFGMPVDPGNLLLMAHHGQSHVLGLPGCARSPKLNGFDWVLQRIAANIPVSRHDIMTMGAGGLLMEIPSRPMPRAKASPQTSPESGAQPITPVSSLRIAGVVLAAGQSRRMGPVNKLLQEVDGKTMVAHAVDAAIEAGLAPVVVVTGHEAENVRAALEGRDVEFAHNPAFDEGMSTSLRAGIAALSGAVDGAVVALGDMPRVDAGVIRDLIEAFNPLEGRAIGVPTAGGKRGNPILWAARYFPEMMRLAGDVGARHLIGEHAEAVYEIDCGRAVITDIDTPEALAGLAGNAEKANSA